MNPEAIEDQTIIGAGRLITRLIHDLAEGTTEKDVLADAFRVLLDQTKLVIWDLDDTFWHGTLAEGQVSFIEANVELVQRFTSAGILNSVCSNNAHAIAWAKLKESKCAELFIFPRISWEAKGAMVASIIRSAQLRPQNVLFLDDNRRIREEVEFANPGCLALDPATLAYLRADYLMCRDPSHLRLKHYRTLERRRTAQSHQVGDTHAFLKNSRIRISMEPVSGEENFNRVLDLVSRTNQLNFTKVRICASELARIVADVGRYEVRCVRVSDKYGDYGISGFYCLDRGLDTLCHFLFSCRVINMGIENFVYNYLGRPNLTFRGETASDPKSDSAVDWIKWSEDHHLISDNRQSTCDPRQISPRVLFKGGCDLDAVCPIIEKALGRVRISRELHRVNSKGFNDIWQEHTEILRLCGDSGRLSRFRSILEKVPWVDADTFQTQFFARSHDVYVHSLLQDFGCGLYRFGDTDLVLPIDYFGNDLTIAENYIRSKQMAPDRYEAFGLDDNFAAWLRSHFTFIGPMTPDRLIANLTEIRKLLPPEATLILVNGAEVDVESPPFPFDCAQSKQHRVLNNAAEEFCESRRNVILADVRPFVQSERDCGDRLFHYKRSVHVALANALIEGIRSIGTS